jgi:hypothetical protein
MPAGAAVANDARNISGLAKGTARNGSKQFKALIHGSFFRHGSCQQFSQVAAFEDSPADDYLINAVHDPPCYLYLRITASTTP